MHHVLEVDNGGGNKDEVEAYGHHVGTDEEGEADTCTEPLLQTLLEEEDGDDLAVGVEAEDTGNHQLLVSADTAGVLVVGAARRVVAVEDGATTSPGCKVRLATAKEAMAVDSATFPFVASAEPVGVPLG